MSGIRTVFITGGTSGVGLGLAESYAAQGFTVGVCGLEGHGPWTDPHSSIHYFQADVTDARRMTEVIQEFSKRVGRLDLVIANAGINHPKSRLPDFQQGTQVIHINVIGVLNTFGPAVEIMRAQGHGHLAAMSSLAGVIGSLPGMAIYCASKSAILSLCETLAIDLKSFGIKVTALAPGFIDTPLTRSNTHAMPLLLSTQEAVARIQNSIAQGQKRALFPFPLSWVAIVLRAMPRRLYFWIMHRDLMGTGAAKSAKV